MQTIIVTNQPKLWQFAKSYVDVVDSLEYLTTENCTNGKAIRIINLSPHYKYQSIGYYVSLLAEARQHKVLPSITTIQDLRNPSLAKILSFEIDDDIQENLASIKSKNFVLSVYFGKNIAKKYDRLSQKLHKLFPTPLFRVYFSHGKKWYIKSITPILISDVPDEHRHFLEDFAKAYFNKKRFHAAKPSNKPYDMAILVDPTDKYPPSNSGAIELFMQASEEVGFDVELITKDDFKSLSEYDALFIRETTSVNHHTYLFSRCAAAEGLVVIDDPVSILRCTNKVYLSEILQKHKIPTPKTFIFSKKSVNDLIPQMTYPCVLKLPDSSFSQGVIKVEDELRLKDALAKFFTESELILGQEFMPTTYDWRIGVLDGKPLYACRYYMAKNHWQIYNWQDVQERTGDFDSILIQDVPELVLKTALKATHLIGDGLYGVDLKQKDKQVYVIEINDNPTLDQGIEDSLTGNTIYQTVMTTFLRRIKKKHGYE